MSVQPVQLSPAELPALARALGDSPETAIPVHRFMRAACSAYIVGEPARFEAAVVLMKDDKGEVQGFGEDNLASLWVAAKVGLTEVSRRTYVIPFNRVQA